jgi:hypothetical protein
VLKPRNKPYINTLALSAHSNSKMNYNILKLLRNFINIVKNIFAGIWGFLTIIVIIFLIHRFLNPGWKSISNIDLKNYAKISLLFLPIIGILHYLRILINRKLNLNKN